MSREEAWCFLVAAGHTIHRRSTWARVGLGVSADLYAALCGGGFTHNTTDRAEEVTCAHCLEKMAAAVEHALVFPGRED